LSTLADDGIESDLDHHQSTAPKATNLRVVLVVTVVMLLILVVAAVFAFNQFRDHQQLQTADDDRASAVNTAQQFALRMDTFNGQKLKDYQTKVNAMLTTRAKGEFQQSFPAFEKVYQQGKAVGTGTVRAAGVETIDQDSATVLVIHDRLVKSTFGNQQQYLRWSIQLDKIGGAWKVDKFEDGS
jgi:Mce-associated membrane protein